MKIQKSLHECGPQAFQSKYFTFKIIFPKYHIFLFFIMLHFFFFFEIQNQPYPHEWQD